MNTNDTITVTIIRRDNKLAIGYEADRTAFEWPATALGLADLKAAIKADDNACAEDFDAIDALALPEEDGRGDSVELHGGPV